MARRDEVGVRLRVRDSRKFNSELKRAGTNVRALGLASASAGTSARRAGGRKGLLSMAVGAGAISKAANVGALSLGAAGVAVLKLGSDFESKMAKVRAVSGSTGAQFTALKDLAIEQGRATKFSASESADAMYELASAGVKPARMASTLKGTLSLAAASGIDLASAAEIQANALGGFGLAGDRATHVADVLAQVTADSSVKMTDLQYSMKYIGPIAKATGQDFETMSAALGIMGNAGIKGEQAGTSIRGGLLRLVKPTKSVEAGFAEMGAKASDFYGPKGLKPLPKILDIIRDKTKDMSASQRNQAIASVFGTEALSGMQSLLNAQPGTLEKLIKRYKGADGASKKMATTMNDTVKGATDQATGSMETLAIQMFEFASPALKGALLGVASGVNAVGGFIQHNEGVIKGAFLVIFDSVGDVIGIVGQLVVALTPVGLVVGGGIVAAFLILRATLKFVNNNFSTLKDILTPVIAGFVAYKAILITTAAVQRIIAAASLVRMFIQTAAAIGPVSAAMLTLNMTMLANPVVLIAAAFIALIAVLVLLYTKVGWFRNAVNAVWAGIKTGASAVIGFIRANWPLLLAILAGPFGLAVYAIVKNWDRVKAGASAVIGFIANHWPLILAILTGPFGIAVLLIVRNFDRIKGGASAAWAGIRAGANALVGFFRAIPGRIGSAVSGMWNGLKHGFRDAVNFIIRGWNNLSLKIGGVKIDPPGPGSITIPSVELNTPNIPLLAKGGVVRTEGSVVVGDQGPELLTLPQGARVDPLTSAMEPATQALVRATATVMPAPMPEVTAPVMPMPTFAMPAMTVQATRATDAPPVEPNVPAARVPTVPTVTASNADDDELAGVDFPDPPEPHFHLYIDGREVAVSVRKHSGDEKARR